MFEKSIELVMYAHMKVETTQNHCSFIILATL